MDIMTAYESENLINAEQIAAYLVKNPDFFTKFPQVIEQISIPHIHKGSVSLMELQSEQLRKKVRSLSHKLNQLINVAKQNEFVWQH
jgi:uncharacterized protein YigA (DUF484 family)